MIKNFRISDTSPASASTAAGSTVAGLDDFTTLVITGALVGATGGTLDVYLQTSHDAGTTWYDLVHFTQLAAGAAAVKRVQVLTRNAGSALTTSDITVGVGTTPALAANANAGGSWGDRIRALYVAGASTSAGAALVIDITGFKQRA